MTREITHMKAFTAALESLGKPRFSIGQIPPTPVLVDQFFNDSTGRGEDGEGDAQGPWNTGGDWHRVEAPAMAEAREMGQTGGGAVDDRTTSTAADPDIMQELLIEQLGDLLNAEGQLVKALPKMERAAHAPRLKQAFADHLAETEQQVERLKEVFVLVGADAESKTCKGMTGLLEEGEEVIEEGEQKDAISADLALIAAAQKVEHYEISAYGTARSMAGQAGLPSAATLLATSLAEEEIADNLLTQVARELMSQTGDGSERMTEKDRSVTPSQRNGRRTAKGGKSKN